MEDCAGRFSLPLFTLRWAILSLAVWIMLCVAAIYFDYVFQRSSAFAFVSSRTGNYQIYLMDMDRMITRRLVAQGVIPCCLAWSPDGNRLTFTTIRNIRDESFNIYLFDLTTGISYLLTDQSFSSPGVAWSPDGSQLVFTTAWNGEPAIALVNVDGSNFRRLTDLGMIDTSGAWSPDGQQIVFVSERGERGEIYVVNADGGGLRRLTENDTADYSPDWSPDSQRLVFVSERDGNAEIYSMNAGGSEQRRLTTNLLDDIQPVWSPDGQRIAYISQRDSDKFGIRVIDAANAEEVWSIHNDRLNYSLAWSPDGATLAFISAHLGNTEIGVVSSDGSELRSLTRGIFSEYVPEWLPLSSPFG